MAVLSPFPFQHDGRTPQPPYISLKLPPLSLQVTGQDLMITLDDIGIMHSDTHVLVGHLKSDEFVSCIAMFDKTELLWTDQSGAIDDTEATAEIERRLWPAISNSAAATTDQSMDLHIKSLLPFLPEDIDEQISFGFCTEFGDSLPRDSLPEAPQQQELEASFKELPQNYLYFPPSFHSDAVRATASPDQEKMFANLSKIQSILQPPTVPVTQPPTAPLSALRQAESPQSAILEVSPVRPFDPKETSLRLEALRSQLSLKPDDSAANPPSTEKEFHKAFLKTQETEALSKFSSRRKSFHASNPLVADALAVLPTPIAQQPGMQLTEKSFKKKPYLTALDIPDFPVHSQEVCSNESALFTAHSPRLDLISIGLEAKKSGDMVNIRSFLTSVYRLLNRAPPRAGREKEELDELLADKHLSEVLQTLPCADFDSFIQQEKKPPVDTQAAAILVGPAAVDKPNPKPRKDALKIDRNAVIKGVSIWTDNRKKNPLSIKKTLLDAVQLGNDRPRKAVQSDRDGKDTSRSNISTKRSFHASTRILGLPQQNTNKDGRALSNSQSLKLLPQIIKSSSTKSLNHKVANQKDIAKPYSSSFVVQIKETDLEAELNDNDKLDPPSSQRHLKASHSSTDRSKQPTFAALQTKTLPSEAPRKSSNKSRVKILHQARIRKQQESVKRSGAGDELQVVVTPRVVIEPMVWDKSLETCAPVSEHLQQHLEVEHVSLQSDDAVEATVYAHTPIPPFELTALFEASAFTTSVETAPQASLQLPSKMITRSKKRKTSRSSDKPRIRTVSSAAVTQVSQPQPVTLPRVEAVELDSSGDLITELEKRLESIKIELLRESAERISKLPQSQRPDFSQRVKEQRSRSVSRSAQRLFDSFNFNSHMAIQELPEQEDECSVSEQKYFDLTMDRTNLSDLSKSCKSRPLVPITPDLPSERLEQLHKQWLSQKPLLKPCAPRSLARDPTPAAPSLCIERPFTSEQFNESYIFYSSFLGFKSQVAGWEELPYKLAEKLLLEFCPLAADIIRRVWKIGLSRNRERVVCAVRIKPYEAAESLERWCVAKQRAKSVFAGEDELAGPVEETAIERRFSDENWTVK